MLLTGSADELKSIRNTFFNVDPIYRLADKIIRYNWDLGFEEGRQFGRGKVEDKLDANLELMKILEEENCVHKRKMIMIKIEMTQEIEEIIEEIIIIVAAVMEIEEDFMKIAMDLDKYNRSYDCSHDRYDRNEKENSYNQVRRFFREGGV